MVERSDSLEQTRESERLKGTSLLGRDRLQLGPSNSSSESLQRNKRILEGLVRTGFSET